MALICFVGVNIQALAKDPSYPVLITAAFKGADKMHVMGSVLSKKKKLDVDLIETSEDKIEEVKRIFLSHNPKYVGEFVEEDMEKLLSVTYMCFEVSTKQRSTKQRSATIAFPTWRTIVVDGKLEFSTEDPKFFSELARLFFKKPE